MKIKIWLSKNSEVSVREQLIAQISLGITSGDLKAGEKLSSTRELARRFQIHQNTISAAYRLLAERNLVEIKKGSGVYVRETSGTPDSSALENLISRFFQEAAARGFSADEIKTRLRKRLAATSPARLLLIETDTELRKILTAEVSAAIGKVINSISFEEFSSRSADDSQIALIFDVSNDGLPTLPPNKNCILLKANSVADSMAGKPRPADDDLIAVASGWGKFTELAKMFLLAACIAPDALVLRSTQNRNWQNGLQAVSLIVCDAATAREFPGDERVRVFQLIADSSLNELRRAAE